jgi:hypothetical protein
VILVGFLRSIYSPTITSNYCKRGCAAAARFVLGVPIVHAFTRRRAGDLIDGGCENDKRRNSSKAVGAPICTLLVVSGL